MCFETIKNRNDSWPWLSCPSFHSRGSMKHGYILYTYLQLPPRSWDIPTRHLLLGDFWVPKNDGYSQHAFCDAQSLRQGFHQFHVILLMEEILHQLIWWKSHYLQAFINPKWCRIFFHQQQDFRFRLISWKWSTQSTTPCAQKEERTTSWWFQFSSILPQELVRWFPIFRPVHLFSKKLAEQIIKLPRKVIFFPPGFSCP